MAEWCTIESDPGVFTELISEIGVKDIQVAELYDLEPQTFQKLSPVHGLIFLFKWEKSIETGDDRPMIEDADGVFFAKQMISNACGTQAILSVLMNCPDVQLGPALSQFKEFTESLDSGLKGEAINNSDLIRKVHNSFARPEPFISDEKAAATDDDETYHFVGYVPVNGILYELDGLKPGPIVLGDCDGKHWYDVVRPAIQDRMNKYKDKEIRFTLLALIKDRKKLLTEQLQHVQDRAVKVKAAQKAFEENKVPMDVEDAEIPKTAAECKTVLQSLSSEEKNLKEQLSDEEHLRQRWKEENIRRKHNYVPFVYNLVKQLAARDQLAGLIERGKKAHQEAVARAKKAKEASKKK